MSERDIEVLNSSTKILIDSLEGYGMCCELADNGYALAHEFHRRQQDRERIVAVFQRAVTSLGGEPQKSGSANGTVHLAFLRFAPLFTEDERAAISALDEGEDFLVERMGDLLNDGNLLNSTRNLLLEAMQSAISGERLAEQLEN